jgi:26S proteasome regulatory subunit N11
MERFRSLLGGGGMGLGGAAHGTVSYDLLHLSSLMEYALQF